VLSQENERSCICVLKVSNLPLTTCQYLILLFCSDIVVFHCSTGCNRFHGQI
jgi:hypothetical protein